MATRTITETDCDGCKKTNVTVKSFALRDGSEPDPAGGRAEPTYKSFDLCIDCLAKVIYHEIVPTLKGYELVNAFVKKWVEGRYRSV